MIVSPKLLQKGLGKYCSRTCLKTYEQIHGRTTRRLGKALPTAERFWTFVEKTEPCWLWIGGKDHAGYGDFWTTDHVSSRAHRFAYELTYGLILSPEILVCHICDNPSCVRPDHLFLGTSKDNRLDAMAKDRHAKGSASGKAKLTEADIPTIRASQGIIPSRQLAKHYGVNKATILSIWQGKTWIHVK